VCTISFRASEAATGTEIGKVNSSVKMHCHCNWALSLRAGLRLREAQALLPHKIIPVWQERLRIETVAERRLVLRDAILRIAPQDEACMSVMTDCAGGPGSRRALAVARLAGMTG
jgi:hypothetical protein